MSDREITYLIKPLIPSASATALLERCRLPATDISTSPALQLFGISAGPTLLGMIGLEVYPPVAMLRSLAVAPETRDQGLGKMLVEFAEHHASVSGITSLYLLTTTADSFFERLGYARAGRENAPEAIRTTAQFAGLCPAASTFMVKHLTA